MAVCLLEVELVGRGSAVSGSSAFDISEFFVNEV